MDSKSDDKKPKRVKLIRTVLSKKSEGSVQSSATNDLQTPKKILSITKTDDNRVNEKKQSDSVCSNSTDKKVIANVDNSINQSIKSSESIIKTSTVVVSHSPESKSAAEDILKGNLVLQKAEQKEQPKQLLDISVKPNVTAKRPKLIRPTFSNKNQSTVEKSNLNLPKSGSNSPVYGSKESVASPRSCRESDNDCKEKVILSIRQTEIDNEYNEKGLNSIENAVEIEGNGKQCYSEHDVTLKEHTVHQFNKSENESKEDKASTVNYELKEGERLLTPVVYVELNKISPLSPAFNEPKEDKMILTVNEELKEENTSSSECDDSKEGKLVSYINNKLREEKPALPVNDEMKEEKPASPIGYEEREEKLASFVNNEHKEETIILSMRDKSRGEKLLPSINDESKEEKLLSPINDKLKEENLASLISDGIREENPALPVRDGVKENPALPVRNEVEEKLAPPVNELNEQKPTSPVSDETEEKPTSPSSGQPREKNSPLPISGELGEEELPSCIHDELKEENTVSSLYDELKEDKFWLMNDELKNRNPESGVSDEIKEKQLLVINDKLKEKNPALPPNESREENPASLVSNKIKENPVFSVSNKVEENPVSPVKDEVEENPVSPVKDEVKENPVSPVKDEVEENPVSPVKDEVEENLVSPVKDEVEEKSATLVKDNKAEENAVLSAKDKVEEKPASPVGNEIEEKLALSVKGEVEDKPVSPASNEMEEKPASLVKGETEEKPDSTIKGETEEKTASSIKDETEEKPASPVKDEVEEKPASPVEDEVEEKPASPVEDEVEEKSALLASNEVEEKPASSINIEVEENPTSSINIEIKENPASPVEDEVEEKPVSPVNDEVEEKSALLASNEVEEKPAPSVNNEVEEKLTSSVNNEVEEKPASSVNNEVEEKSALLASNEVEEKPTSSVNNEVEEKPASSVNNEVEENPASPISNEVEEKAASPINELKEQTPASPINEVKEQKPASPINELKEQTPASSINEVKEQKPASPINELKEEKPASPVNEEAGQKIASPLNDKLEEEKPAMSVNVKLEEVTPISHICNDQKEEEMLPLITDELKEEYLKLPVRAETEEKPAVVVNDELKEENVILEVNKIDNELKEEKSTAVAHYDEVNNPLKENEVVLSAHSNGNDKKVRKEDDIPPVQNKKTDNEMKEKEISLFKEANDEQGKITISSDYKLKNELNEKEMLPAVTIDETDIELNKDTKESEQCDKIENELKEEEVLHETNDLNEKRVTVQNNDTLEEKVPSTASIIEDEKRTTEEPPSVDMVIPDSLEKTKTKDTSLPDEISEIASPTEQLHSSNRSDDNSHLPIATVPDAEHIETGDVVTSINTVDKPLIGEKAEAGQNLNDNKFSTSRKMEIKEEKETAEEVKQLNIAATNRVNSENDVELTVDDNVKVDLLQNIESKVEHISKANECTTSSGVVDNDQIIGAVEKEKNDGIVDRNDCSDDDDDGAKIEEINDFNENEVKQPTADRLYEEKLPEEKPVKNTFQAIRKSDTVIIVKKSEINADEIKSYVKSSKFKSKFTKSTESSKQRENVLFSLVENKGDIGKNVTVYDSKEVDDDVVKTDRIEICNEGAVLNDDGDVQEIVDKCADIESREVTDTCDPEDDGNINNASNADATFNRAHSADRTEQNLVEDEKIDQQSCVNNTENICGKLSTVSDNREDKRHEKLPLKPSDNPDSSANALVEENVLPLLIGDSKTDYLSATASCTAVNEISLLDETKMENESAVKISKRIDDTVTPVERDSDSLTGRVEKSVGEVKSALGASNEKGNADANRTTTAAVENRINVAVSDSNGKCSNNSNNSNNNNNNVDSSDSAANSMQYCEARVVDETVALVAVKGSEQPIAIDPGIIVLPDGTIRKKRGRKKKCLVAAQANNVVAVSVPKPESQSDKPLRTSSRIASRSSLKAGAEKSAESTNVTRPSATENDLAKDGNKAESSLNEDKSPLKKRRKKIDIVEGVESVGNDLKEEVAVVVKQEEGGLSVTGESQPKKRRKKMDADAGKAGTKEEVVGKQKVENDVMVTVVAESTPKKRKKRIDVAEEAADGREESVGSDQEPIEKVRLSLSKKRAKKIPALIPVKSQQQLCKINVDEPLAEIRVHLGSIPSVTSVVGDKSKIPRTIKRTISTRLNKVKEENSSKKSRTRTPVESNNATEVGIPVTVDLPHQTSIESVVASASYPEDRTETVVNNKPVDDDVASDDKLVDILPDFINETNKKRGDTIDNVRLSNSANTTDDIINARNVDRSESSAKDTVDEKVVSHVESSRISAKSSSSTDDNGAGGTGNNITAEKERSLKLHLSVQGDCVSIKTAKKEQQQPSEIPGNSEVTRDNVNDNAGNGKVEEKKPARNKGETLASSALDYSLPQVRLHTTNASTLVPPTAGTSSKSSGTKRKEKSHDSSDRIHPLILHVKSDEKNENFDSLKSPNKRYILDGLKIKKLPADVVSGSASRYSDQQQQQQAPLQHQLSQNQPWSTPEMLRVERLLKESNVTITPILQSEPELSASNSKSISATSGTGSGTAPLFTPKPVCTTAQSPMFTSSPTAPMFTSSPTSPIKWDAISQFQSLYSLPFCSKDSISSKFINKSSSPATAPPMLPSTVPTNPSAFKPQAVLPPLPSLPHGPGLGRHFIGNSSGSETAKATDVQIVPLPSSAPVKPSVDVKSEIRKKIAISEQRKQKQSANVDNNVASSGGNNSYSTDSSATETITPDVAASNVAMAAANMCLDQPQQPISLPQFFDGNIPPPIFPPTATTYITARGKIRIRGTGRRGRPPKTLVNARNEQLMKEYLNMSRESIPPALASFVASTQSFMESNFKRFANSQAIGTAESTNSTEAYTSTNAKVAPSDAVPEEQQTHGHFMFPIPLFDISEQSFEQTPENEYNQFVKAERSPLEQPPATPVKGKRGRKRKIDVAEPEPDPVDPVLEMEEITRLEEERVKKELEKERKMEMRKQRLKERNELAKQKRLRQKQKAEERQKRLKEKKLKLQEEKKKLEEEIRNLPPTLCSFDDETRMSADNGQSSQPAPPSVNVVEGVEEDECSGATTESQKTKKRVELSELESKDMTVDQIAEYQWPIQGGELYMIQEQISHYLGVKSFKRKYPDIKRRPVDSEERAYLVDSGLVSESLCDLGITAVPTSEVLDIMCADFPDKYEELRKHMREKQAKELSFRQKAWANGLGYKLLMADGTKQDLKKRAMESASNWNVALNKSRKEDRRCVIDLQTYIVHYPRVKTQKVADQSPKIGSYPVSILPGQYCDHYKPYTPDELRYLPVNTVLYGPIKQLGIKSANDGNNVEDDAISVSSSSSSCSSCSSSSSSSSPSDDEHEVQSVTENIESVVNDDTHGAVNDCNISGISDLKMETDADQNEMTDCAVGDHEYAMSGFGNRFTHHEEDEDLSNDAKLTCRVCHDDEACSKEGLLEELIHCSQCHSVYHAGCLELSTEMIPHVKKYNWLCTDCKVCVRCLDQSDEDKMLFCDLCDRGYHIYCVGMKRVPNGRWHCSECAVCDMCGTTEPGIAEDALWFYEYKKLNNGKNQYVRCLCLPCARKVQDMIGPPPAQRQQLSAQQMPYSKMPSLPLSSTGS